MTLKECYEAAGRRFPFTVERHFAYSKAVIVSRSNSGDYFMSSDGLVCAGWEEGYMLLGPTLLVQAARLADKVEQLVTRRKEK